MKYLITGGLGYIGENIQLLQNCKHDFGVCDYGEVHSGDLPLAHHLEYEDILPYDGIIHLAALSGLAACEADPRLAVQENILTLMNVVGHASKRGIPLIFTSSQAAKDPKSSIYANIKWTCEQICHIFNEDKRLSGKNYILRLANVYGGHHYLEKKNTCVKQFIINYGLGEPLIIHGDGKQKRDFIHVYDVVDAIMLTIENKPFEKSPMDIGTGKATSIMELQEMFPRKRNQHYEFKKIRNVGAESSIADTSIAKDRIGFEASIRLEEYINQEIGGKIR
jgi:UDP-glucose 4-epimerase